jgi:signal transduction histidine kinase
MKEPNTEIEMSNIKRIVVLSTAMLYALGAWAGGSTENAEAMVNKAIAAVQEQGADQAYLLFNDREGDFVDGDLYVFVVDYDGVTLAHGGNSKLVGKNMKQLKDADGNFFIQAMIAKAQEGGGWVDYKWSNPETKKIQDKTTYVLPIEGADAFVGCGIYK